MYKPKIKFRLFISHRSLLHSLSFLQIASSVLLKKPDCSFLHSFCQSPLASLQLTIRWRFLEMIKIFLILLKVWIKRWNLFSLPLFSIPFFFVGFSGLPIWKGRYMQLFQRINVDFFVGIGYGVVGGILMCYMSWLIVSIFISYVLFIYLLLLL